MPSEPREIVRDLPLSRSQERLLDLHSVANVLTLLHGRLQFTMRGRCELPDWSERSAMIPDLVEALADGRLTFEALLDAVSSLERDVLADLGLRAASEPAARDYWSGVREGLAMLFATASIRLRELMCGDRHAFQRVPAAFVVSHLREFLVASEAHAAGAWRFVFEPPAPPDGWYLDATASGPGGLISFPPVLHDVIRDLVANARKYGSIGGTIRLRVEDARDCITIEVGDDGRGIPESEIERVVEFGFRGSNAADRPTYGYGAGLTKAYVETKRLGGRLWIASLPGWGTLVRLTIPIPA